MSSRSEPPSLAEIPLGSRGLAFLLLLTECLLWLVLLPVHPHNAWVRAREGRYQGVFWQRFWGGQSPTHRGVDWLLIGSGLGETRTVTAIGEALGSAASWAIMSQISEAMGGPRTAFRAPFKAPWSALLCLVRWRPKALAFADIPADPHLVIAAAWMRIPVVIANVNLSEDRANKLARSTRAKWLYQLCGAFLTQAESHRGRLTKLGVPPKRIHVVGVAIPELGQNLDPQISDKWRQILGLNAEDKVIVAGSTYADDEAVLLEAGKEEIRILAPRRLDRINEIELSLKQEQKPYWRRSNSDPRSPEQTVILLDTVGELREVYSIATVAYIGGTMNPDIGGHTPLEAATWKLPLISGPNYGQQEALMDLLKENGVLTVCRDAQELKRALQNPPSTKGYESLQASEPNAAFLLKLKA